MHPKLLVPSILVVLALVAPAGATGDGLPSGTNADPGGVTTPAIDANYIVAPAGRGTMLARVEKGSGRLTHSAYLDALFVMPAVALDGTPGGLSADGGRLVLIRPRAKFPQRTTTLAIVDGRRLKLRRTLRLKGDFSYDALSPDGHMLYLIQYTSRRDVTQYAVRAYDLERDRLVPGRIVDAREPDEDMSGYPLTRATSPHGRWAYTLYDGTHHPFVHALDTVRGEAFCIDLDLLAGDELLNMGLDLAPDGRSLTVTRKGTPVALIDTRKFTVSDVAARATTPGREDDGGPPWPLIGVGLAAMLLATGGIVWSARRRRRVPAGA